MTRYLRTGNRLDAEFTGGVRHTVFEPDFVSIVRQIDTQGSDAKPASVTEATGKSKFQVDMVFRFLMAAGAITKEGKGRYIVPTDLLHRATFAWMGADPDDIADEEATNLFGT
jgi:hypothetical protein